MKWLSKQAFAYRQAVVDWHKPASGSFLVPTFFLLLFAVGAVILPDYGIGWDEDGQHEKGRIAYDYVHTYLPGWMVATIPIFILFAFIGGIGNLLYRWVGSLTSWKIYDSNGLRMDLFQAALLIGAISAIIYFGSVLYDAWRHVYFIYPALVYLSGNNKNELIRTYRSEN
ncbi:MAG: hypothetical protein AAGF89_07795 [Bacteroidota bacterium]